MSQTTFSLDYASKRSEVWRWYWKRWQEVLWKLHLLLFLVVAGVADTVATWAGQLPAMSLVIAALCGVVAIGFLPLYPLVMFKPKRRHLNINENGISTSIASKAASRNWSEVASVIADDGSVIFNMKNGNAFIVPARAFTSRREAEALLDFSRRAVSQQG